MELTTLKRLFYGGRAPRRRSRSIVTQNPHRQFRIEPLEQRCLLDVAGASCVVDAASLEVDSLVALLETVSADLWLPMAASTPRSFGHSAIERYLLAEGAVIPCVANQSTSVPSLAHNVYAADTTNTDQLWSGGGLDLDLTGAGVTVGIWDIGIVRSTHERLIGRVTSESGIISDHSTHVAGTVGANNVPGTNASARGMATAVSIRSYNYTNDAAELTADAEDGVIDLSNHSYGHLRGWTTSLTWPELGMDYADTWLADRALFDTEDPSFGKYTESMSEVDAR